MNRIGATKATLSLLLLLVVTRPAAILAAAETKGYEDSAAAFHSAQGPGPEHEKLAELAGEFVLTARFWPDQSLGSIPEETSLAARRQLVLGGRALSIEVGSAAEGFEGLGLMGYDRIAKSYWYVWTDSATTGLERFEGSLDRNGLGSLTGGRDTPAGREPVTFEIRHEGDVEVHEYTAQPPGGEPWRFLELRYERER